MLSHFKILIIFFFPVCIYALTVNEAVEETLQTNPQMQKDISDYISVQKDLDIAYSGYKPTLDFNAAVGEEESDKGRPGDAISLTPKESQLIANQNLFEGLQTKYDIEEQEARIESRRYTVLQSANTLALRTIEVYIQVLQQKKILDLLLLNVRTHERIYTMIKEKTDAGLSKLSDLEQTHGRLALAYSNYIAQQNNYQDTLINFEKVFGRMIASADLEMPSLPSLQGPNQASLIHIAKTYSPTLQVERSNVKTLQARYEREKSNFFPSLDFEVSGQWNEDLAGFQGKDESYKAMLRLSYNLYNGGVDEAVRVQNLQLVTSQKELLNEQERAVIEKLKLAYMAEHILKNQIRCLRIHAKQTRKTADAYAQEYQLGRRTLLDLLNTELEYNTAQQSLENAIHDHLFARYRVLEAMGILNFITESSITERVDIARPESFMNTSEEEAFVLAGEVDEFINMSEICLEEPETEEIEVLEVFEEPVLEGSIPEEVQEIEVVPEVVIPEMEDVYFGFGSSEAELPDTYLNQISEVLNNHAGTSVRIEGHTDNTGSHEYNMGLSLRRAEFIKDKLILKDVNEEKITAIGRGEEFPKASNADITGRKLNRRVEVNIQKE